MSESVFIMFSVYKNNNNRERELLLLSNLPHSLLPLLAVVVLLLGVLLRVVASEGCVEMYLKIYNKNNK